MTIGQRIAALRKAAGLSQEALASELGVSRQAIGKWEADASLPGIDNLQELARALGTSCDCLLTGEQAAGLPAGPAGSGEPVLSLEGARTLLAEGRRSEQKRYIPLYAALAGLVALVLAAFCVILYYTGEVRRLQSQVSGVTGRLDNLDGRIDQRIGAIEGSIRESLEAQASIVASWDLSYGAYSAADSTAAVQVRATPKTFSEGMSAAFVFTLSDGRIISANGVLQDGAFTASTALPLADSFVLQVSFTGSGVSQNQQLTEEYGFRERYTCTVIPGPLLPPGGHHSSLSPDLIYTREAAQWDLTLELPYLDGELLDRPAKGILTLAFGGSAAETIEFSFDDAIRSLLPGRMDGFGRASCAITVPLEEKAFTLPWKEAYENGGWPEGVYTLTLLDEAGEPMLSMNNLSGWNVPATRVS